MPDQFTLTNDATHVKAKFKAAVDVRQPLLLVDMDDLPGQQSFIQLNGPNEKDHEALDENR